MSRQRGAAHRQTPGGIRASQSGVGLIEVLVALIVLSVGFLTAARMQVQGLRDSQSAYHRSQALLLIGDMMDRMRNNPAGVAAGYYDNRMTAALSLPACPADGCNPQQVSDQDLYDWSARLRPLAGTAGFMPTLPQSSATDYAEGSISAPVDGVYTLTMSWTESGPDGAGVERVSVSFVP